MREERGAVSEFKLQKIEKYPNGIYHWECPIDLDYYRGNLMRGVRVCAAIAAGVAAAGAAFAVRSGNWRSFYIVLACAAGFLGICALIFVPLFLLGKNPREYYELSTAWVKTGAGRDAALFAFERTKKLVIHDTCVELRGNMMKMRVYAPAEDFPLIRDFIKVQVPAGTKVIEE